MCGARRVLVLRRGRTAAEHDQRGPAVGRPGHAVAVRVQCRPVGERPDGIHPGAHGDAERVVRHPLTDHQRSPETIAEHDEGSQAVPQALGEAVREVQPFPVADGIRPRATLSGNGVEIVLDRQLLLVVRGGTVRTILNTSTGNREEYTSTSGNRAIAVTPKGTFKVYRGVDGPLTNSLGQLWRPRFFYRGIAVHGSPNIPPWPASHGCARLSNAAINMIWDKNLMPIGSTVVVR